MTGRFTCGACGQTELALAHDSVDASDVAAAVKHAHDHHLARVRDEARQGGYGAR